MNVKIAELMTKQVITAQPHDTADHIRHLMERNRIHVVPIVDSEGIPVGVVSTSDLVKHDHKDGTPVSNFMSDQPVCVNAYDGAQNAARAMRNHRIHHVFVTEEKKLVGLLSSYDLLKLVEEHRFVAKNPPTKKKRGAHA